MWARVLGPISVEVDGQPVELGGPKQRLVLALLALRANRPVAVDELIDDVWGEDPPGRPRKTLQVYVANLRRLLRSPDRLTSGPAGYALRLGAGELDLVQFDRLLSTARGTRASSPGRAVQHYSEALALWSPPALGDLRGFEAAARLVRPLEERRWEAVEELMVLRLSLGQHAELVGPLQELCAADPWRERWWALLMQACYHSGRQADALDAYRRLRGLLRDELGVDPGPELRALAAAVLRQDLPVAAPAAPVHAAEPASERERRTATFVAFSIARLARSAVASDPEDLADLTAELHARVRSVVQRHGGFVDSMSEHEVVAAFGYPMAAEDDAVRAARAALDVVSSGALLTTTTPARTQIALGIDTGVALFQAGRPATGRARASAVALAEAAAPGEVLVSALGASLLGRGFLLEPDTRTVTGVDAAPSLLGGEAASEVASQGAGTLLGREAELEAVHRALVEPASPVVLLHGEPGVGRTSLLGVVVDRLQTDGRSVLLLRGDRYRRDQPWHPLVRAVGSRYRDVDELVSVLGGSSAGPAAVLAAAAQLPGTTPVHGPTGGGPVPGLRDALVRWLQALARGGELIVAVDDLHDVDPDTLGVVSELPDEVAPRGVVLTSRTWSVPDGLANRVRRVPVGRLGPVPAGALVRRVVRPVRLRNATVRRLVEAADGHPWHLAELALAAVRQGDVDGGGVAERVPDGIPVSLQASLLARLDALGADRVLVQRLAACRGEFTVELAGVVASGAAQVEDGRRRTGSDEEQAVRRAQLAGQLERLVTSGLLRSTSSHGTTHFRFAHSLLEDLAYTSLPRAERVRLHRHIADWMIASGRTEPESLAQQLQLSGRLEEAAAGFVQASSAARRNGDFAVSAQHARHAVQLLDEQAPSGSHDALTLAAILLFATSSKMVLGYHPDIDAALRRATDFGVSLDRADLLNQVYPSMISTLQAAGRYADAKSYGEAGLVHAMALEEGTLTGTLRQFHWATLIWMGRLPEADTVLDPRTVLQPPTVEDPFGHALQAAIRCAALSLGGLADLTRGRPGSSLELLRAAEQAAEASGSPDAQCLSHVVSAIAHQLAGQAEQTRRHAERTIELALAVGNDWWFNHAQALLGWAVAAEGNPAEGAALIEEALEHGGSIRQHRPHLLSLLADARRWAGKAPQALEVADSAVAEALEIDEGFYLPHVHLVRAAVLDDLGQATAAQDARAAAAEVAQRQGQGWYVARSQAAAVVPA